MAVKLLRDFSNLLNVFELIFLKKFFRINLDLQKSYEDSTVPTYPTFSFLLLGNTDMLLFKVHSLFRFP